MKSQIRSELLKVRTTRTVLLLLALALALTALGVAVEGLVPTLQKLGQADQQRTLLGAGAAGGFFATLAGLLLVTAEFRYGTIRPTFLLEPRRRRVLAAKAVVGGVVGITIALTCLAVSIGAGLGILAGKGVHVTLTFGAVAAIAFGALGSAFLDGAIGVAIGTLIRNQVGAIVAVVAYAFVVDAPLFAAAPSVARYLPGKASDALAGQPTAHLLSPAAGGAVFAAWTIALLAAAALRTQRSDV